MTTAAAVKDKSGLFFRITAVFLRKIPYFIRFLQKVDLYYIHVCCDKTAVEGKK